MEGGEGKRDINREGRRGYGWKGEGDIAGSERWREGRGRGKEIRMGGSREGRRGCKGGMRKEGGRESGTELYVYQWSNNKAIFCDIHQLLQFSKLCHQFQTRKI